MTVDTTVNLNDLDLADPDIYTAPDSGLGVLHYLQEHRPMFWNKRSDGPSFWAFTKYADGVAVYLDKTNFTSERGMQVGQTESAARAAAGKMLIVTDGRHSRLRDVMNPALTPRVVRRLEGAMRETVGGMLEENAQKDSFDFVDTVAGRLPLSVICELLGVPRADWDLMIQWTRTAFGSATSDDVISDAEKAEANANIFAYYADLLAERRDNLGDDVISVLIRGRIDGTPSPTRRSCSTSTASSPAATRRPGTPRRGPSSPWWRTPASGGGCARTLAHPDRRGGGAALDRPQPQRHAHRAARHEDRRSDHPGR